MALYASVAGLPKRVIVPVPVLSPRLSSLWVGLVTPIPTDLARPLIDSLVNEVVVHDHSIDDVVPHQPIGCREAIELALQRVGELEVSRWTDAELYGRSPADPIPTDPDWAGATVLVDRKVVHTAASPDAVYAVISGLGGTKGWLSGRWLWIIRGWLDLLAGGVGMRRGRRDPTDLRVGDVVDFWRVEALERGKLVRLRAEMKLPGDAWIEWSIERERRRHDADPTRVVPTARTARTRVLVLDRAVPPLHLRSSCVAHRADGVRVGAACRHSTGGGFVAARCGHNMRRSQHHRTPNDGCDCRLDREFDSSGVNDDARRRDNAWTSSSG